jgi:hypothetical protein
MRGAFVNNPMSPLTRVRQKQKHAAGRGSPFCDDRHIGG